ncbi:MAG TPA: hypothetical protein PK313_00270, partial [Myxococcota bacterium]|nr:hypothetical protein [Myxococcota bacterium]
IVPEHAEVANAVGAVVSNVSAHETVAIRPSEYDSFTVYAPDGRHEVAGAFDSPSTAEVDALLAVVYRARLVALGASPGASDGGPIV